MRRSGASPSPFDFWFRFVMSAVSDIEGVLGSVVAHRLSDQRLSDLFSKRPVSDATARKCAGRQDIHLVTLDEMYV